MSEEQKFVFFTVKLSMFLLSHRSYTWFTFKKMMHIALIFCILPILLKHSYLAGNHNLMWQHQLEGLISKLFEVAWNCYQWLPAGKNISEGKEKILYSLW